MPKYRIVKFVTNTRRYTIVVEASTYGFKLTKRSKNDHSEEEVPE